MLNLEKMPQTWWAWGIFSFLFALCIGCIGWYAVGNLAVLLCGFYVLHLAGQRYRRIREQQDVVPKMSKAQKKKLAELDEKETMNIVLLSDRVMAFLCGMCAVINVYTLFWNMYRKEAVPVFTGVDPYHMGFSVLLLILDLGCLAAFYLSFRGRVHQMLSAR